MSCYFRRMKEVFQEAGIEVSEKKDIDRAIHNLVHVKYKDCMPTWRKVKEVISKPEERSELIQELRRIRG